MLNTSVILLTSAIFAFCESAAILDKINQKCSITDVECHKTAHISIFNEAADNGLPDLDIPRLDPFEIKNMEVVALGMIKFTMTDGTAKGLKSCNTNNYKRDIENQRTSVEIVCDLITVEGNYKIESTPAFLALAGGINLHGEGKGSVAIEKLQLNLDSAYEVKKLEDGELHFQIIPDESSFNFNILEKATIAADNIFVGKQDISTIAVNIANENWEFFSKTFGKSIHDKIMEVYYQHLQKFFTSVPAKDLVTDDLSSYVKS